MLKKWFVFVFLLMIMGMWGCGDEDIVGGGSDFPADYDVAVFLEQTGKIPQFLLMDGQDLMLVNSGDNTVWKVHLDGQAEKTFIDLGKDSNPYHISVGGDYFFVTNSLAGRIDVVEKSSGRIRSSSQDKMVNPMESVYVDGRLFVAVSEFDFKQPAQRFGSLYVYKVDGEGKLSLEKRFSSSCNNSLGVVYWKDGGRLINIGGGRSKYDESSKRMVSVEDSCVDIYDVKDLSLKKSLVLGKGSAGSGVILDDKLYMGSGTSGNIFVVDLKKEEVLHDVANPMKISEKSSGILGLCEIEAHKLMLSSFNEDKLYIFNTVSNSVEKDISIGTAEPLLGVQACVKDGKGGAYVIMNLGEKLYKVLKK